MKRMISVCALIVLAAITTESHAQEKAKPSPPASDVPGGLYALDKTHAFLTFRVNHLGLSRYTARFKRFDAQLQFEPANPVASRVTVTVDPRSLETDFPLPAPDFNAKLLGPDWLNAEQFPQITFRSTSVELTGPNAATITGDLELHGATRPVTLETTFNGGYSGHPMDPSGSRVGFSATGAFKRSEFGIVAGIPPDGSRMGVSDEVEVIIEAEFTRPAAADVGAAR